MNLHNKQTSIFAGVLTVAFTLAVGGCGKKDEPAPANKAKPVTVEPAEATKKPLTAAWFGKVATPPAPLAAFKVGMPVAEAKKLTTDHFIKGIDIDDVSAQWQESSDGTKLSGLVVTFPVEHKGIVTEAWGRGTLVTVGKDTDTVWLDPAAGLRARLTNSGRTSADLRFVPYLPASKLLGDGPQIAFFSKPVLGVALADVKKSYAEYLDGDDLRLPISDFTFGDGEVIRFEPSDGSAPVTSYQFEIEYKSNPAFKDELLALFENKWGKPTVKSKVFPDTSIYPAADLHVEIDDEKRGLFTITVRAK